jgi:hypothetical protein
VRSCNGEGDLWRIDSSWPKCTAPQQRCHPSRELCNSCVVYSSGAGGGGAQRTGDEEAGHGHELVSRAVHVHALQEAVQQLYRRVHRRVGEGVVLAELRDPVHQQAAHTHVASLGVVSWPVRSALLQLKHTGEHRDCIDSRGTADALLHHLCGEGKHNRVEIWDTARNTSGRNLDLAPLARLDPAARLSAACSG